MDISNHLKELLHGAGIAFTLKVAGALFMFSFGVLVTRNLGAEASGTFFLALTLISILGVLSRAGLDNVIVKTTAGYRVLGRWASLRVFYKKAIFIGTSIALCVAVLIWVFAPTLSVDVFNNSDLTSVLRILSVSIVPLVLLNLHGQFLRGMEKIAQAELILSSGLPITLFIIATLALGWGVFGFAVAYVCTAVTIAVLGIVLWKGKVAGRTKEENVTNSTREMFRTATPLFIATIMGLVIERSGVLFLGIFRSSAEVAIFEAATRTTMAVGFLLAAINSIGAPKFAALYAKRDMKALGATAQHGARLLLLLAAPVLIIILLIPGRIMSIYGNDFIIGGNALVIMAVGQFVNAATGSVGYLLMMTGNEVLMRNIVTVAAVLHVILCSLLIPRFGILGAATATATTLALSNVALAYYSWAKLRILAIGLR